jgi:hypothetical protein
MVNDQTDVLQAFLDSLNTSSPDQNLFTWDDEDETDLLTTVTNAGLLGSYPQHWHQYMVEIDLATWVQIRHMTLIPPMDNPHPRMSDRMSRIAALFIRWPSSPIAFLQSVVAPLDIIFDPSLFAVISRVVDGNHKEWSTPADFEAEDFWTTQNLEDWLSARSEILCRAAWQTSLTILERVQAMDLVLNTLPQVSSFACAKRFAELNFRVNRTCPCMHYLWCCNGPPVTGTSVSFLELNLCLQPFILEHWANFWSLGTTGKPISARTPGVYWNLSRLIASA